MKLKIQVDGMDVATVKVSHKPKCDFCGIPAEYDFRTAYGPWAYGCKGCWIVHRLFEALGTGKGAETCLKRRGCLP